MILADTPPPASRRPSITAGVTAFLLLLLLVAASSCADKPPTPMSADEAEIKAEQKAAEHRVFYEGWLHPG